MARNDLSRLEHSHVPPGQGTPHKIDAQRLLERCIADRARLVTDTEVFQEILHRYVAIHRKDASQPAFETLLGIVDDVLSIDLADVQRAKEVLLATQHLSARNALHVAVMERHEIPVIMSFDQAFDGYPGISRLHA